MVLEEVTVTAQKREQSLQDVSIAITAFSGDDLRGLGVTQSNEFAEQVPNVSIGQQGGPDGFPLFFVRGVGLTDFSNANSGPIAIYMNDVYLKAPRAQNFTLFDIEQLEILRGPQGTLFGRNSSGGAVLFRSRRPGEKFESNFSADYGSFDTYNFEGGLGGPISENLQGRFAVRYANSDGNIDNLFTGDTQPGSERLTARGTLVYTPSDTLEITAFLEGGSKDGLSTANKFRGKIDPATGGLCSPAQTYRYECMDAFGQTSQTADLHKVSNNLVLDQTEDFVSGTLRIDWDINDSISFASITNYLELDAFQPDDTDASPMRLVELLLDEESDQFTQEFNFSGTGERSDWVVGMYYLNSNSQAHHDYEFLMEFAPLFASIPTETPVDVVQGLLGGAYGLLSSTGVFTEIYDQNVESLALFGQYEYDLSDQFRLIVGLRYTDEKTKIDLDTVFTAPLFPVDITGDGMDDLFLRGTFPTASLHDSISDDNLSGKIALDYRPVDNTLIYGSISTAFKAGGYNTSTIFSSDEAQPFGPEEITAYEIGFKSDLADNRVRLNGAAFIYDYENMQVFTTRVTASGAPARFITNAAVGDYKGAELELLAMPTDGLTIQLGVGYIDAELKDFFTETRDPDTGELVIQDFSGARPGMTPEWSFNALARYEWPLFNGTGAIQADYSWRDDFFHTTDNDPYRATEAYGVIGGRLSWRTSDEAWEFALWGRNLTDEGYITWASDLSFIGLVSDTTGVQRSYGISVSYHY